MKLAPDHLAFVNIVCVTFPFGVCGRMWNAIVSVPDHFRFIYFSNFGFCISFSDYLIAHDKYKVINNMNLTTIEVKTQTILFSYHII